MSTSAIYGDWETHRVSECPPDMRMQRLWHCLAEQGKGTDRFMPNSGLTQRKNEIIELWKLFYSQQPKVILEIGTAQGGTFAAWCRLAPDDATIISIDRDPNDCRPRPGDPIHPEIYNGPLAMTCDGGGVYSLKTRRQIIHSIAGWSYDSSTISQLNEILNGRKIDFLWHDASHQPETFAKDWRIYWPMVADGGIFASHDTCPSADPNSNKSVEWERIRREEQYSAIYEYRPHPIVTEMGIGVIFK